MIRCSHHFRCALGQVARQNKRKQKALDLYQRQLADAERANVGPARTLDDDGVNLDGLCLDLPDDDDDGGPPPSATSFTAPKFMRCVRASFVCVVVVVARVAARRPPRCGRGRARVRSALCDKAALLRSPSAMVLWCLCAAGRVSDLLIV